MKKLKIFLVITIGFSSLLFLIGIFMAPSDVSSLQDESTPTPEKQLLHQPRCLENRPL